MKFKFLILCSFSLFFFSCGDVLSPELVKGCTIEGACNYDPEAVIYDGYCVYASDDGEGNYMGNTSDGESTVFDCEGACLIDSDSDGFCEDFDTCPEDPLNECSGCNIGDYDFYAYDDYGDYVSIEGNESHMYFTSDFLGYYDDLDVTIYPYDVDLTLKIYDGNCNLLSDTSDGTNNGDGYCYSEGSYIECYSFYNNYFYIEVINTSNFSGNYSIDVY